MAKKSINRVALFIKAYIPILFWSSIIFFFSSQQKLAVSKDYTVSFLFFKSLHLIEYAILYGLWVRALHLYKMKSPYLAALILTFLYGLSDELHQQFVPTREGKIRDAFIDALGGIISWLLITHLKPLKKLVFS